MGENTTTKKTVNPLGLAALGGIILVVVAAVIFWPASDNETTGAIHTVRRRNLEISVREGGSLVSHGVESIKSEVEGQTQVIDIIPDGTIITEQDVANGLILVRLDSSDLEERHDQQIITTQNAEAANAQAVESYTIQENQNESNIKAGELKVRFARLDLEKLLGKPLADKVIAGEAELPTVADVESLEDLPALLEKSRLGGAALKDLRQYQADIKLAAEEAQRAEQQFEWSKKLGPKEDGGSGYITGTELDADRLAYERQKVQEEQAQLALQLFLKYDLPKDSEKLLSDYIEAGKELERIKAKARAELSKALSDKRSKELTYKSQKDRLDKLESQLEKCVLRATHPGMVVYASTGRRWWAQVIEKGMNIRENQEILTVAGPKNMAVQTKVHESAVRMVKPGLPVRIIPDAFKEKVFQGQVESVGTTPDTSNPMNRDLKVYLTMITVDEVPPDLKPGMSARVEIMIDTLEDVIAVPVQAVSTVRGKRVCYVVDGGPPEMRPVVTGGTNDQFIEIKEGLTEGEQVLLYPPEVIDAGATEAEKTSEETEGGAEMPGAKEKENVLPNMQDENAPTPTEGEAPFRNTSSGDVNEQTAPSGKNASPGGEATPRRNPSQGGGGRRGGGKRP